MANDAKESADSAQAPHKSPASYQSPNLLTGKQALACDMDRPSAYEQAERPGDSSAGSRYFSGVRLLAPLAIWILIVIACLSFLSLTITLNKTMITLDSLVKLEQQRLVNPSEEPTDNTERPAGPDGGPKGSSDWLSLPGWMSLEQPSPNKRPPGGAQDLQTVMDGIFQSLGGRTGSQDGAKVVVISNSDSDAPPKGGLEPYDALVDSVMSQMLSPLNQDGSSPDEQRPARRPPLMAPTIANVDRLSINVNSGHQHRHRLGQKQHQLSVPAPQTSSPEQLDALDRTIDGLLAKLGQEAAVAQETQKLMLPLGLHQPHLMPARPDSQPQLFRHQQHLAERHPSILLSPMEPPANAPPLNEFIPPMFGRPNGLNGPLVISLDSGMPSLVPMPGKHSASSPYELRPMEEESEREPENERIVIRPRPEEQPSFEQLLEGPVESRPELILVEPRASTTQRPNKMQDLFKLFFGPPPTQLNAEGQEQQRQSLDKVAKPSIKGSRLFPDEDEVDMKGLISNILELPDDQAKSKDDSSRLFPSEQHTGLRDVVNKILELPTDESQPSKRPQGDESPIALELQHPDDRQTEEPTDSLIGMLSSPQFSDSTPPARVEPSSSGPESSSSSPSSSAPSASTGREFSFVGPEYPITEELDGDGVLDY